VLVQWKVPGFTPVMAVGWDRGPFVRTASGQIWDIPQCRGCITDEGLLAAVRARFTGCFSTGSWPSSAPTRSARSGCARARLPRRFQRPDRVHHVFVSYSRTDSEWALARSPLHHPSSTAAARTPRSVQSCCVATPSLRRFLPALLEVMPFKATGAGRPVLDALGQVAEDRPRPHAVRGGKLVRQLVESRLVAAVEDQRLAVGGEAPRECAAEAVRRTGEEDRPAARRGPTPRRRPAAPSGGA
jgi:hypothetical protein